MEQTWKGETAVLAYTYKTKGTFKLEEKPDVYKRQNVVYVKEDSVTEAQGRVPAGFREVQVETGVINSDYVEIVSGDLDVYKRQAVYYTSAQKYQQFFPVAFYP